MEQIGKLKMLKVAYWRKHSYLQAVVQNSDDYCAHKDRGGEEASHTELRYKHGNYSATSAQ